MSDFPADTPYCTFHPKVPTLLSCTRCERPACPDCLVDAAVGRHCVGCLKEHAKAPSGVARELTAHQRKMRRPGWVFWSITGLFVAMCAVVGFAEIDALPAPNGLRIASFVMVVSGWVVSLCLHEWAHAYVAFRSGDYSVLGRGYLTMDPRKYADPIFSVAIPIAFLLLGGIGLPGGAVWIDHSNIRSRARRSLVSLAGPLVNIVFGAVCVGLVATGAFDELIPLKASLTYLGWLEFATAALNLLPIPGLDGYGIIEPYLPYGVRAAVRPVANYAVMILLFVFIARPGSGQFLFDVADWGVAALGVDEGFAQLGRFIGDVQLR